LATTASTAVILPLIPAGPMLRGFQFLNSLVLSAWAQEVLVSKTDRQKERR
jgi:hypothetical protein